MNGTERRRTWAAHLPAVLAGAGTVFVAATAFVLAYGGSKGAALDAGISPAAAGWYPLCIEGALVVASVSTVILRGKDRAFAWIVLLLFVAVSTAANVLHSLDHGAGHWWSPYAAAVPPLSLPICTWLAERVALSTLHAPLTADGRAATAPVGLDSAGPVTPPDWASGDHVDTAAGPSSTPPPSNSLPAAVDGVRVDAPVGVHPDTPETSAGRPVDGELDASTAHRPDTALDIHSGSPVDVYPTPVRPPRRSMGGRRTGRSTPHRPGRPAGHSPGREQTPDWRTVDWYAVALDQDVKRARAYEIMKADPDAVEAARGRLRAMNGSAP